jgi:osmoprotectant transport system ATP-binding protein
VSQAAPAVRFDAVGVTFRGAARPAVDGVSLDVGRGELVVLLGPSGSGKTTLMKTVNRLVEPTAGRVLLEGRDVRELPPTALRRRIGYVIQATGLFPHMRVEDNIAVVPELLGWERRRIEARVDELLALVNLPLHYRPRYPRELSGGEAQRVGIARALAADPAYLLMDEPFGALDAINRERLQSALLRIQARLHKTILFVTHDVDEAIRLADRIAVLQEGRLVQYARPLALLSNPADTFVADLLDSDDLFRELSLLPVRSVMAPAGEAAVPPDPSDEDAFLRADADLRLALMRLMRAEADELPVLDAEDRLVGRLSLADLRRVSRLAALPEE